MNIARLSINRPVFISSIVILIIITGWISLKKLGVDLFPDVNIPVVTVTTIYAGAGPEEIENLISKPIEEELSGISGLKRLSSRNQESLSVVIAEFNLSTDIKYAEQQVRDKTSRIRRNLPDGIEEPVIIRFDPADQPIARLSLSADLPPAELYDLAKEKIKPMLERINNVGSIKIIGGTRREIQVELDRNKLNTYQISAVQIANQLRNAGSNIPVGKNSIGESEISFRTIGEFKNVSQIENSLVSFVGDISNSVTINKLAKVIDGTEEKEDYAFYYGPKEEIKVPTFIEKLKGQKSNVNIERERIPCLFLTIYKQSGTNTVAIMDELYTKLGKVNEEIANEKGKPKINIVFDGSKWIRYNIEDVTESIVLGIILAVIVVYLFLGNVRSTIITGLALPNSLLGAFILMYIMGFTVNVMSLLALSLCVGLLVDDAIVVRENIFRKLEEGMDPERAAEIGTQEVTLAVIATSATVIAVFLPIGFLSGVVGQFFKQFGLTVVFAMLISMFDALTIAPMLSAYFAGNIHAKKNIVIVYFDKFQTALENGYGLIMRFCLKHPVIVIIITGGVLIASFFSLAFVKKTFLPPNDQGEYLVQLEMPPGTSLEGTYSVVQKVEAVLKKVPEVNMMTISVGSKDGGEANTATIGVQLLPSKLRSRNTSKVKDEMRTLLKDFEYAKPKVNDYSAVGGGVQYPFNLNLVGDDLDVLEKYSAEVIAQLKSISDLTDISTSFQAGKPEFQIKLDNIQMQKVGVTPAAAGAELRYQVAGIVVGKLKDKGIEYDIRMRLREDQRNLKKAYKEMKVPNIANKLIPVSLISEGKDTKGPAKIIRQDRARVIQIFANLAPGGAIDNATNAAKEILEKKIQKPAGVKYNFVGQSEDFRELLQNIIIAFGLALVFIYLVLASLYESFITPVTILFAIPPAISGAFFSLAIFNEMLNLFSMIGVILLMGLVTKNSILLVDNAMERIRHGLDRKEAIYQAGLVRLRPILMTTLAMIAGTIPIALGLGEAAKSRTAMGIAIIGGLFVSTLITLIVVPTLFGPIDRIREAIESRFSLKKEVKIPD